MEVRLWMARTNNLNDGWKSLVFEWSWTRWWPRVTRRTVVSTGVNHTFKVVFTPLEYVPTIPPLSSYVINIFTICRFTIVLYKHRYIYAFSALRSEKGRVNMLRPLFLLKKYKTNIDDVGWKAEILNQKSGVFLPQLEYTPVG